MTPVDYGITAMLQVMIGFITPFVGLSLHGAIGVQYFKLEQSEFKKYVSSCFGILIGTLVVVFSVIVFFEKTIHELTKFPMDWLWTVIIICLGQYVVNIFLTILRVEGKANNYAYVQILQTVFNLSLSLWLIIIMHLQWEGRVLAQLGTGILFSFLGLGTLYRKDLLSFQIKREYVKAALKFGVPLIPHCLSGFAFSMIDRLLLTNMVGIYAVGIYTVGTQIGSAIGLLATSFNNAYSPWLFEQLSIEDNQVIKLRIVRYTYSYFVIILAIALIFSYTIPFIMNVFLGKSFQGSSVYVWGSALAGAFNGMYYMVVNYIFYVGKTHLLAMVTFLIGVLHIVITYFAIKMLGSIGANYASVITGLISFILVWKLSASVYKMPWKLWYK